MDQHALLANLLFTYTLGLVSVVVLARARVPAIVALMAAGVVAGPSGLGLIKTPEEVDTLAEIGIVLLLFTVGLDFSLAAMRQIWKPIVISGTLQMIGTGALVALVLALFGVPIRLAIFVGLFVALSSTAIVLKGLAEHNQVSAPHGRLMVGILLLQDLAIVVLLLLVPILSGQTPLSAAGTAIGKALVAIGIIAGLARIVLPPVLRAVTASGRREAFPLAILVASIGTALAASLVGLSMAVGAFLAGLMLAESEFSHQAYAEIRGVRDILGALFFISLGMLLDLSAAWHHLPSILAITAAVVAVKAIGAAGALLAAASPLRVALTAAIGLSQVGEFSFILGRAGLEAGLVPSEMWQPLLGASILTMVATPSLLAIAPSVAQRAVALRRKPGPAPADGARPAETGQPAAGPVQPAAGSSDHSVMSGHVIVFGFGAGGQLVARALRELHVGYIIMELNGVTVRQALAAGEPIIYGDAMSPESLHGAHVEHAAAVVSVISDSDATRRMVKAVRALSPTVPIVVRSRYRIEAEDLQRLGATIAVAEELEASLEVLAQLLARLHVAGNVIEPLLDIFRRESVGGFRPVRAPRSEYEALPDAIRAIPVATHRVEPEDWAIGRSLTEIDLRAATGASVLAIQTGGKYTTSPAADTRIQTGDVLYLLGDDSDIALARMRVTTGG